MEHTVNAENPIEVVVFTDPLCCWSAALQPHINKLKEDITEPIQFRYCLAGMIPDWNSFSDPINSIIKPAQMGPVWMEAKYITGADVDDSIWVKDPPSSSFPSCIAVKTAGLQSKETEERMLFALRDAVMKKGLNISKESIISEVAKELVIELPDFNIERFRKEYNQLESRDELRKDMNEVKSHRIGRFPTLAIRKKGFPTVMVTGYRPYEVLLSAFSYLQKEVSL